MNFTIKDFPNSRFTFFAVVDELFREVFYATSRESASTWIINNSKVV